MIWYKFNIFVLFQEFFAHRRSTVLLLSKNVSQTHISISLFNHVVRYCPDFVYIYGGIIDINALFVIQTSFTFFIKKTYFFALFSFFFMKSFKSWHFMHKQRLFQRHYVSINSQLNPITIYYSTQGKV